MPAGALWGRRTYPCVTEGQPSERTTPRTWPSLGLEPRILAPPGAGTPSCPVTAGCREEGNAFGPSELFFPPGGFRGLLQVLFVSSQAPSKGRVDGFWDPHVVAEHPSLRTGSVRADVSARGSRRTQPPCPSRSHLGRGTGLASL